MSRNDIALCNTLHKMITENTGRSFLDSGSAYGRNWERNQGITVKALKAMPSATCDQYGCYTINVFQFLRDRLYLDDVCKAFNRKHVPTSDWDGDMAYGLSAKGQQWLEKREFSVCGSDSGFNTYNDSAPLSQVLQGTWLTNDPEWDGEFDYYAEYYLLLQLHGGCDVRGGYTDARLFLSVPSDFYTWDVYGTVTRKDGDTIEVTSTYTGHSLTTDSGEEVEIGEDDTVSVFCPSV